LYQEKSGNPGCLGTWWVTEGAELQDVAWRAPSSRRPAREGCGCRRESGANVNFFRILNEENGEQNGDFDSNTEK
jgi:hypothetical protein